MENKRLFIKKFILGLMSLFGILTMSLDYEANIRFGYDFARYVNTSKLEYSHGSLIGIEILPVTLLDTKLKLGAGLEYNFGAKTLHFVETYVPFYAVAKYTYYRDKATGLNLYTLGRFGYVFYKKITTDNGKGNSRLNSGIYYGAGFGLDYKYFLVELLYDGSYTIYNTVTTTTTQDKQLFLHKAGIRVGLQLGTQHFYKPRIIKCLDGEPFLFSDMDRKTVEVKNK